MVTRDAQRATLRIWDEFLREKSHILLRAYRDWPPNKCLLQVAMEQGTDSPVRRSAEDWLAEGKCDWIWLRRVDPAEAAQGPCLAVMEGHTDGVGGALILRDGRLVSWASQGWWTGGSWSPDTTLRIWHLESGRCVGLLEGHTDRLWGARLLRDGRIVSWSADKTVRLWDVNSESLSRTFDGFPDGVSGVLELSDGRLACWGGPKLRIVDPAPEGARLIEVGHESYAGQSFGEHHVRGVVELSGDRVVTWDVWVLRLWNSNSGQCLATLNKHTNKIDGADRLPDGRLLSWSFDHTLRIWDSEGGALEATLEGHTDSVWGATALGPNRLLSWSADATLRLWRLPGGEPLLPLSGHRGAVRGARLLSDGRLVSWSDDKTLRTWDLESGRLLDTWVGHDDPVWGALPLSANRLVSWDGYDDVLPVWDAGTGRLIGRLQGHGDKIRGVQGLPDGKIVSWSDDRTLRIWNPYHDFSTLERTAPSWPTEDVERTLAAPPNRYLSWSGTSYWSTKRPAESSNRTIQLWDSDSGDLIANLSRHHWWIEDVRFAAPGRIVSWSDYETEAYLWDTECGALVAGLKHVGCVEGMEPLSGERLLSWDSGNLFVWNARSGARERMVNEGHGIKGVFRVGDRVVSWSRHDELTVRDLDSLTPRGTMEAPDGVSGIRLVSEECLLFWSRQRLWLWDLVAATAVRSFEPSAGAIDSVLPLVGGRVVAWGRNDKDLRLWAPDGSLQATLQGHRSAIRGVVEGPSERLLSWSENEMKLRLWDGHAGQLVAVCEGHRGRILGAGLLSGGVAFVSWSFDETLRLWDSRTGECLGVAPERTAALAHPDWTAARARAAPETQKLVRCGMVGWVMGPTVGISPDRANTPCIAVWHGDTAARAWELLEDGTVAVSLQGGRVVFLKLHRGSRRINSAGAANPMS